MQMSDVIADMLTRIRNANDAKHATVDIPASNMKKAIADILVEEGYVKSYQVIEDGKQGVIRVTLKYTAGKQKVIRGIRRVAITTTGQDLSAEQSLQYTGLYRVCETKGYFYLFLSSRQALIVNKNGFTDPENITLLRQWLQSRVKKYKLYH